MSERSRLRIRGRTHEEVVRLRAESPQLEQLQQVKELAVYITTYLAGSEGAYSRGIYTHRDRRIDVLHVPLLNQDLARLQTQPLYFRLSYRLAFLQPCYLSINKVSL